MKKLYLFLIIIIVIFSLYACKKNVDIHYDELPTNEAVNYEPISNVEDLPLPKEVRPTSDIIHDIILDRNNGMYTDGDVQACGFLILDEEDVDPLTKRVTGFVSYGEYNYTDGKLEKVSGSGEIPTAITFNVNNPLEEYEIQEILTENNLTEEVHDMFKEKDWDKVLKRDEKAMKKIRNMEEEEALKKLDIY